MSSDIVGRTPTTLPGGLDVVVGLGGLGLAVLGLLAGAGWLLTVFLVAMGVFLAAVAMAQRVWLRNRPSFVISDDGVEVPLGHMPLVAWRDIAAVHVRSSGDGRCVNFDAVDPDSVLGARPALMRILGRLTTRRTSTVLWIPEAQSPLPVEDLVREMDSRYEAAVGRPLPPHPVPEAPRPRGLVEGLRQARPGERKRIVIRMGAGSAVLFLYALLFVKPGSYHSLVLVCMLPLLTGFAQRHPWSRLPDGIGRPSSFRREVGVALLLSGVVGLALVVKALWKA